MISERAVILERRTVARDVSRLLLQCRPEWRRSRPGQFLMLGLPDGGLPLLRRPFSIHGLVDTDPESQGVNLLVKKVGPVTGRLSLLRPGAPVDLLGPLGRGFRLPQPTEKVVLAAGGIGAAPLVFLLERMRTEGLPRNSVTVFLGGRNREDLVCRDRFEKMAGRVHTSTDDGSDGDQCMLTDPLQAMLERENADRLYACGPEGMLQCIAGMVAGMGIRCQVSLETMMACGMGVCLGCAVKRPRTGSGYLHTCVDGPVFDVADVDL